MPTITITKGDSLSQIAGKYGTDIKSLMSANPQIKDPNKIFAGASLTIPEKTGAEITPITEGKPAVAPSPAITPTGTPQIPLDVFGKAMSEMRTKLGQNQDLMEQKRKVLMHLYDRPLSEQELKTLSPTQVNSIMSGDRRLIDLEVRLINDELKGRSDTLDKSVKFLTETYSKEQERLDTQKEKMQNVVVDFVKTFGSKTREALLANYGEDYVNKLEQITGLDLTREFPKTLEERKMEAAQAATGIGTGVVGAEMPFYVKSALGKVADFQYIDMGKITSKQLPQVQAYAATNNIPFLTKQQADLVRKDAQTITSALTLLKTITNKTPRLITATTPEEVAKQAIKLRGGALLRTNTDAKIFLDTIGAFTSMLTRAAGEKGVLTDFDVARIKQSLPSIYDTKDIAEGKIAMLEALFKEQLNTTIALNLGISEPTDEAAIIRDQVISAGFDYDKIKAENPGITDEEILSQIK